MDSNMPIGQKAFNTLCMVLIASTCFSNLLQLPSIGSRVQLTEIIFLFMLPVVPVTKVLKHQWAAHRTLSALILAYLLFDLLSSILSHRVNAVIESCARCYLFAMCMVLAYFFSTMSRKELLKKLTGIFLVSAALIIVTAVIGYLQVLSGGWSRFIYPADNYPYFGTFYRFRGPTIYPSMMISIAICIIAYLFGAGKEAGKNMAKAILMLFLICTFLTLSKSLLLAGLLLLALLLKRHNYLGRKLLYALVLITTFFLEIFTHVIFIKDSSKIPGKIQPTMYTSGNVLYRNNGLVILETDYLNLKKVELDIFKNHPLLGVGTGNFSKSLPGYVKNGSLPARYVDYDPHSTYLGALSENGIFAGLLLLAFLGYIFYLFYKQDHLLKDGFMLALFIAYLCFLIDGTSTDILNFRHFWVFIAIAIAYLNMERSKPGTL